MNKETFTWKDENGIPQEYPISEVGKVIFGVEEGKEGEETVQPPASDRVVQREVLSEGRIQEELKKARTVSVDKKVIIK